MMLLNLLTFLHLIHDVHLQNVRQPRVMVSPEVITERGSVQLHCDAPHNVTVSQCYFYPEKHDTNIKLSPSCQLSLTGSELITWSRRSSPGTFHIICYYTVDKSGVNSPSPHSVPSAVTVLTSSDLLTRPSTTRDTTNGSLITILSVSGVCVFLTGLMIVCLGMCIRRKMNERRKLNTTHCDHGVMMSIINMNNSCSDGLYAEIRDTLLHPVPSDPGGNADSQPTADDVYHLYSTVAYT